MTNTNTAAAIPTVTLNNGVEMPILGFGVFQVGPAETRAGCHRRPRRRLPADRHRGRLRQRRSRRAPRSRRAASRVTELFITTKLWVQDPGEDNTTRAFEDSLRKLGLDHVDLYLIHQPFGDYYAEWRAMEQLAKEGRARAIGVSNFAADRLLDLIINNEIVPAVNQIETNPFHQRVDYQELMTAEGVQIESWGPFAEGKNGLFTNPLLTEIGAGYDKSVAQVVLRWMLQRNVVVIPKSVNPERMAQNLDVFDFALSDERHGQDRHARRRLVAVLRPPRPRHGALAQRPSTRLIPNRAHQTHRKADHAQENTRTGPRGVGHRLRRDGDVAELRAEPRRPRRHDRRAAVRGRSRRDAHRHRRGLRTVRQRGAGRRGDRPDPRSGRRSRRSSASTSSTGRCRA